MLAFWSADVTDRVDLQEFSQERELGDSCMFKLDSQASTARTLCRFLCNAQLGRFIALLRCFLSADVL